MTKEEEQTIKKMKKIVSEYEQKEKEKKEPATKGDLDQLLKMMNQKNTTIEKIETPEKTQTRKKMTSDEREQLAYQIYKDAKTVSIVCLITIVFPMITIFVTMFDPMIAMIIALLGVIYPCVIFIRMINLQTRAYRKYGWKPLFYFPQQQQRGIPKKQREDML